MTVPVVVHDCTDPGTIPAAVRRAAFDAAMVALVEYLAAAGYTLDAIAELEVLDDELRRIVAAWDGPPGMVH